MNRFNSLIVLFFTFCISCKSEAQKNYELISDDDGIIVEKFDSAVNNENKYNDNNRIFKVGNSLVYKFEHISTDNQKKLFRIIDDEWEFVNKDDSSANTISAIVIGVEAGNPMAEFIPEYNQTNITYTLGKQKTFSMSGLIENEANIWMHPPRDYYFRILELNPFPYIKAPYKVGNKWTWKLEIGDSWADERWKTWSGKILNEYNYQITDNITLKTAIGDIDCLVINSSAKSRIGETSLISYFNPTYGFVKLNYTNIDSSQTNLDLIEFTSETNN